MEKYQERVIEEKQDLDGKIERLNTFLQLPDFFQTVPDSMERSLLRAQYGAMKEYSRLLGVRIAHWEGKESGPA